MKHAKNTCSGGGSFFSMVMLLICGVIDQNKAAMKEQRKGTKRITMKGKGQFYYTPIWIVQPRSILSKAINHFL